MVSRKFILFLLVVLVTLTNSSFAQTKDPLITNDAPLEEALSMPDWFELSLGDLRQDLAESRKQGKKGLILFLHHNHCPYCKAHLERNWGRDDIRAYTQKYFNVIAINIAGSLPITDLDGQELTEKQFALLHGAFYTPTILFVDSQGKQVLKLTGFRPPYQFRAALEFVADGHYQKESFRYYLARAKQAKSYGKDSLNPDPLFLPIEKLGKQEKTQSQKPVVVFFESRRCHACDVLHAEPLQRKEIRQKLSRFDIFQLDMWSNQAVVTPSGEKLSAKQWADKLDLSYSPTLVFFNTQGKEILRIDSVVGFFRLNESLNYALGK